MKASALLSVEEYLAATYRPDCDYVVGVLVERNVGEYDHSRLQTVVQNYLFNREKQWAIRVVVEQRVQVKPNRFRVPDVCVAKSETPIEQIFTHPPFLCVEILSPSDRMSEMQERIGDYLAIGVRFVWLLDPRTRRAYVCTRAGMQEAVDGTLRTTDPSLAVPFKELFN